MIYWFNSEMKWKEPPLYKTMTVVLDLNNSDPTQWATYADDAVNMTAGSSDWDTFFGHYPCILDNGVELGKLNPNNFGQYEDGTTAPITTLGKDVMICFPKRGIKLEYLDESHLSVSMTDEMGKSGYSYMAHSYKGNDVDRFYLGTYKGYVGYSGGNYYLYSTSNMMPSSGATLATFRDYAHNRGTGYEQSAFFQLTFRQVMYLLKYKGQDAQIVIGKGYTSTENNTASIATGNTNTRGMDWGESTGTYQMKLFGLEDFYGNIYEFIDGIMTNSSSQLYVADGNYNDSGTNYTSAGTDALSSSMAAGFLRYPNGTNLAGFTLKTESYGLDSTYFCDYTFIYSSRVASFGGAWGMGLRAGVFTLNMSPNTSTANSNFGARLMYFPTSSS